MSVEWLDADIERRLKEKWGNPLRVDNVSILFSSIRDQIILPEEDVKPLAENIALRRQESQQPAEINYGAATDEILMKHFLQVYPNLQFAIGSDRIH